jgi:hypothetical protein
VISNIPRYRMISSLGHQAIGGTWVRYEDHTVAIQAVKSEYSEVRDLVDSAGPYFYRYPKATVTCGCPGGYVKEAKAPTPAELIPTLKEHEWVRFRVSTSGRLFTSTTYFDGDGSLCADDYQLRGSHAKSTAYNVNIESIERCEAPVVK